MTNKYKDFIIFNVNQFGAAKAMAAIECSCSSGNPTLYGDVCCVGFWVNETTNDKSYVTNQVNKCKKILKQYDIKYKYATFKI